MAITIEEALRPKAAGFLDRKRTEERLGSNGWLRAFLAEGAKTTIEIFKAGDAAGFHKNRIRRGKCRINAVARREGFGGTGQWSWGLGGPLDLTMIAFKGAKGIKDCRLEGAFNSRDIRAIFGRVARCGAKTRHKRGTAAASETTNRFDRPPEERAE